MTNKLQAASHKGVNFLNRTVGYLARFIIKYFTPGVFPLVLVCCLGACRQKQPDQTSIAKNESLPYYSSADFTPVWIGKGSGRLDTLHSIPAFSFTDQNGNNISEKNVANKIYVADFFFTACPGICPKLARNLKIVQDAFANDDEVLLLSHSVTPDKDIPAVLKRYAANYSVIDSKWYLLTGNKDAIYNIARKFYFADEDLGMQRNSNDFLHTENMLLIDKHRRIRGVYKGTSAAEMNNIIADIKKLKEEKY